MSRSVTVHGYGCGRVMWVLVDKLEHCIIYCITDQKSLPLYYPRIGPHRAVNTWRTLLPLTTSPFPPLCRTHQASPMRVMGSSIMILFHRHVPIAARAKRLVVPYLRDSVSLYKTISQYTGHPSAGNNCTVRRYYRWKGHISAADSRG